MQEQEVNIENRLSPFSNAYNALLEVASHTIVVSGMLISFKILELLTNYLWENEERKLFDELPLHYIFDAADLALLICFIFFGSYSVIQKYRGKE